MMKMTGVQLELFTEPQMLNFIQKGIRGGLTQVVGKYARANNKYIEDYNSEKDLKTILYVDANNLYGYALGDYLPQNGFKWVPVECYNQVIMTPIESATGYILEVDVEYPEHLHDLHRDLPLCPEHVTAPNGKEKKLMATLYNKKEYVIHYRNLQQCLELGLKVIKVHRILSFRQSQWLKKYIDFNAEKRQESTNDFDKAFWKLANNAVFGKHDVI